MVSAELLKTIQKLERQDKLYLMQVLRSELANEESGLIKSDLFYPIWSPYDAFEAADTMLEVIKLAKSQTDE